MKRLLAVTSAVALALGGTALAQSQPGTSGGIDPMTGSSSSASSSGQQVPADQAKQAQNALKQQGLYNGPIDGIVGPQTKSAISQFQKKAGLRQTASLDQQTMSRLMTAGAGSGSSTIPGASGNSTTIPDLRGSPGMSPPGATSMPAPGASQGQPPAR